MLQSNAWFKLNFIRKRTNLLPISYFWSWKRNTLGALIVPQSIIRIILRDRNADTSRDIVWTWRIVGPTSFRLIRNCQCEVVVYKWSPQHGHVSKVWLQTPDVLWGVHKHRVADCSRVSEWQWWLCGGSKSWSESILKGRWQETCECCSSWALCIEIRKNNPDYKYSRPLPTSGRIRRAWDGREYLNWCSLSL